MEELESELKNLIVDVLALKDVRPSEIDSQAPLLVEGLGLDSIDILEIAMMVSKRYGFALRSDDENNTRIFSSLRHLAQHIAEHRSK